MQGQIYEKKNLNRKSRTSVPVRKRTQLDTISSTKMFNTRHADFSIFSRKKVGKFLITKAKKYVQLLPNILYSLPVKTKGIKIGYYVISIKARPRTKPFSIILAFNLNLMHQGNSEMRVVSVFNFILDSILEPVRPLFKI